MNMTSEQAALEEKKVLLEFPNTYCYTKGLAEKAIIRNQGDIKLVICRPSIIAASMSEPFPGWTDSMAAAGGVTILGGLGIKHFMLIEDPGVLDVIPVDVVVNSILISSCKGASKKPNQNIVFHCASSFKNPIKLIDYMETCRSIYNKIKLDKNIGKVYGYQI